jgi:hypothetical protein
MKSDEQRQKLTDAARLLPAWRHWHAEKLEEALAGPHGELVAQLAELLRGLCPQLAQALITFIRTQEIVDWRRANGNAVAGPRTPQPPAPEPPAGPTTESKPETPGDQTLASMHPVKPVSMAEIRFR